MCPFWNMLFWHLLFLEYAFWNEPFLEYTLFRMCSFWNAPFLECAFFGIYPFGMWPYGKKGTFQKGHIPKRVHSIRAHSKKSTFQTRHIPERAHSEKGTFPKKHIPKTPLKTFWTKNDTLWGHKFKLINRYTPEPLLQILIPVAEMEVLSALSNEGFVLHACMLNNQHDLLIIMGTQLSLRL